MIQLVFCVWFQLFPGALHRIESSEIAITDQRFKNGLEFRQSFVFGIFNPGERLLVLTVQFSQSTICSMNEHL
jgi:hypothetical protein